MVQLNRSTIVQKPPGRNRISRSLSLCFQPFIWWRLVCRKKNGAASKPSKSSKLSNMYWAARNKTCNLTEFRIGRCWNLSILFVYIHFRFLFSAQLEVTQYFQKLNPELISLVDKNSSFWFRYYCVDTHSGIDTFSRSNFSSSAPPCEHG